MKSKFLAILTLIFVLCIGSAYADGINADSGVNFISESDEIVCEFPNVAAADYKMYASAAVKNESNSQKNLILLVSVYDANNNLKKVAYDSINVPANGEGTGKVPVTIPKGTQESDFICKAYLWDSFAGKTAYRAESRFLEFNTNLYGIEVDGVAVEDYSDEEDLYRIMVSKENVDIKVYPKSGATSIVYSSINVPGISRIKLLAGNEEKEVYIDTYMEDDPYGGEGIVRILPEGVQEISSYALDGYLYNQLNNYHAAEGVTLSDEKDESGVFTTTASGTVAKDGQIATFTPWADKSGIGENAPANTMHFGFTVNELSDPIYLQYRYRESGSVHTLITFSDSKVVAGDKIDGSKYINVTAPYTVNIFMNTKTCDGYIYVNDNLLYTGNMNYAGNTQWREVVVKTKEASENFKLVTTAATGSVYNDTIDIKDVVMAYMGDDIFSEEEEKEEETEPVIPEGVQNISSYALDGFYNVQLNNNWADGGVTLSDATDSNGAITTTATNSGTVAKDKQIGTFNPWQDKKAIGSSTPAYTMHFGFTVNEISHPVYIQYRYRSSGSFHSLISLSSNKVVSGNKMDGSTYVNVTAPYTVNIFMNTNTCDGYIYVNDTLLYTGNMNYAKNTQWRQVVLKLTEESTGFKMVTSKATGSVYNEKITIQDVIKAYMGESVSLANMTASADISQYALDGVYNVQIDNNYTDDDVALSDVTDETDAITTTENCPVNSDDITDQEVIDDYITE